MQTLRGYSHKTEYFHHHGDPSHRPFMATPTSLSFPPSWNLKTQLIWSPFLLFCHFRNAIRQNHRVCKLSGLTFSFFHPERILWRFLQAVECINSLLLLISEQCSMTWMYPSVFDRSVTEGQLGCFPSMATVVKAAVNIRVQVLYAQQCLFLWDKYPGVQLLDSMIIACLIFKENANIVL